MGRAPHGAAGRFAPSPTGDLHLGNLRTALVAWLSARAVGGRFVVRMEDLDRANSSSHHESLQLAALEWLGLDWDGPVVRQSDRFDLYFAAIDQLRQAGLVYDCWCTRREIREAVSAPHGPGTELGYTGRCRRLSGRERTERRGSGRPPALRFAATTAEVAGTDLMLGGVVGQPHDFVLRRNDGVPAYNMAVVFDDAAQNIGQVVRGDDLAHVVASQVALQRALGLATPAYAHVPLVLGPDGERLAKRHGAVTATELRERDFTSEVIVGKLAHGLGLTQGPEPLSAVELVASFRFPVARDPWVWAAEVPR